MKTCVRGLAAALAMGIVCVAAPAARADATPSVSASDAAEAQQLFDEARALMNSHDYARACPKFAASQQKDPAPGTLLNLANCYAKNQQTASAWVTFKDAAAAARGVKRRDWEAVALKRAAEIEPHLSHLTIRLTNAPAGANVTRDDHPVDPAQIGTSIVVDPGLHRIDVKADGKLPQHVEVTVGPNGDAKDVTVPALADEPKAVVETPVTPPSTAPVAAAPASETSSSPLKTAGVALLIAGGAGVVVGAVTGFVAMKKNDDAKDICPNAGPCGSQVAVDDTSSAHTMATISTIGFVAGGALAAGGLVMFLVAPKQRTEKTARTEMTPLIGPGLAGLGLRGSF